MAKTRMRDDVRTGPQGVRIRSRVDHDPLEAGQLTDDHPEVNPTLVVKMRTRDGYTDDGDKRFVWETVVSGVAAVWEQRTEIGDSEGITRLSARATILYRGQKQITEAAGVWIEGVRWRVLSALTFHDRVELTLMRAEDSDGQG